MSTEARELIAAILWKAQALSSAPTSIYKRRTPSAFLDAGDKAREPFLIQADAILAALPEIIADMVEPLEFVGGKAKSVGNNYLVWPYLGRNQAKPHLGPECWMAITTSGHKLGHHPTEQAAIEAANTHHRTTILKALGMEEGE